jgi:hypothetical protein
MEKVKNTSKKGKYILIGLGVVALAGGAAYLLMQNARTKQSSFLTDDLVQPSSIETTSPPARTTSSSSSSSSSKGGFPLKKGSRGDLVKNIQQTLIARFGKDVLPKYGADGHWGSEMDAALKKRGLPTTITANLFQQILASGAMQMSGLDEIEQLKTVKRAKVWNGMGKRMTIPAHTIIGEFVDAKDDITQFRTMDNQLLFIQTNSISYV